jgi:hypothetical protein
MKFGLAPTTVIIFMSGVPEVRVGIMFSLRQVNQKIPLGGGGLPHW